MDSLSQALEAPNLSLVVLMHILLHPDDQEELDDLRRQLLGWRIFTGYQQKVLARKAGLAESWVGRIERGEQGYMNLNAICKVAEVFRQVIHVSIEDLDLKEEPAELESLRHLSEVHPHNGVWLDSVIMTYLQQARKELDIPLGLMATKLGMRAEQFELWEEECINPGLPLLLTYARELGGRVRLRLERVA